MHIYYVFLRCVYSNMTFQIFIEESGAVMRIFLLVTNVTFVKFVQK